METNKFTQAAQASQEIIRNLEQKTDNINVEDFIQRVVSINALDTVGLREMEMVNEEIQLITWRTKKLSGAQFVNIKGELCRLLDKVKAQESGSVMKLEIDILDENIKDFDQSNPS